jgi:nucleoside-diphosphate-sugar epimerase
VLVAVTGGSGFIGRHLARGLRARGWRVRLIDRAPLSQPFPWGVGDVAGADVVTGDITQRAGLEAALGGAAAVVHLAGMALPRRCAERPLEAFRVNALGTANVVDAAAACHVRRLITASSRRVGDAVARGDRFDAYSASKAAAEAGTLAAGHVVARLDNTYGPGQGEGLVIPDFMSRARAGVRVYDDPRGEAVPLIYVDDAVDALVRLVTADIAACIVHVAAPGEAPLAAVADAVAALAARQPMPAIKPAAPRALDPVLAELGWAPRTTWEDGLARTWDAWLAHATASRTA